MRIVAAMSGGVDSSVAAALLADEGQDVIGLSMQLYDQREGDIKFGSCCTLDDLHDARRVASILGIPHYIMNFERQFNERVVSNFVEEYTAGRTPIPCVRCNGDLKFTTLLDRARGFGAPTVATGHYARVVQADNGSYLLKRGLDANKDQSYFLFTLNQSQLACAKFPLGMLRKDEVRLYAENRALPVARKPDSQELCFVPDGDYATFVERRTTKTPAVGPIADATGRILGSHAGVHRFTVGQRRGLGISSSVPLYVTALDAGSGTVTVGPRHELERSTLHASNVNWVAGSPPPKNYRIAAQIRHQHRAANATVSALDGGRARVDFEEAQPAITPGQAVVFYQDETVLGGGWISSSDSGTFSR